MEADLTSDKRGLGLISLLTHKLCAQQIALLLMELAHNVLIKANSFWSRAKPWAFCAKSWQLAEQKMTASD